MATTTDLGKWMITNGGVYDPEAAYEQLTMVVYDNSTYITLKTVQGVTPIDDHVNYQLMAKGFDPTALGSVQAEDTSGVLGEVGGTVSAQDLIDWVVDQAATKLLKISDLVSVQTNDATKGVSAALAYAMNQSIDQLNSNLSDKQDKVPQPLYLQDININDWNNVSAQGWYSGYNSKNAPTSGWVCAINIPYNGDKDYSCLIATNGMSLYTRCRDGGTKTWTAWREFATK